MGDFIVISDGSGDLSPEIYREKGIVMIPFYVMLGSGEYLEQERDISTGEFYDWMVSHPGVYPKSSTPSTQDYLKAFTEIAEAGENGFRAQAVSVVDFDKDGNFSTWEIDQDKNLKEIIKD